MIVNLNDKELYLFTEFNVAIMDPRFDFYLASTFDYRECEHEDHQSEMTPTSRLIDIVRNFFFYYSIMTKYHLRFIMNELKTNT